MAIPIELQQAFARLAQAEAVLHAALLVQAQTLAAAKEALDDIRNYHEQHPLQ